VGSSFWFTARLQRGKGRCCSGRCAHPRGWSPCCAARHQGARLLLAEDNEINREVALELLHGAGLHGGHRRRWP
jgi:two-component system sensor histidine kinase/response regulator